MAQPKLKGRVVRVGDSPQTGGKVVHVTPEDPSDLRGFDGSYKAGDDAVAVHVPQGGKAPKVGASFEGSFEEVGAGAPGAYLRAKGAGSGRGTKSAGVEAPDEDDEGEMTEEDDDDTTEGGKTP
jgi:hypothetical protein